MNRGEAISLAKRRHGHSRRGMQSPEYLTWCSMLRRCNNPSQQNYKVYGARGIRVCDEWSGEFGFERFFEHVGPKPSARHSIDRIDSSKGYEPGNVRWATWSEQGVNRSSVHMVELNGKTQCISAWEKELGISPGRTKSRMHQGWPLPEALLLPTGARLDPSKTRTPKTHCVHGHEYTPENTRVDRRGARNCKKCHAERSRERRYAHLAPGGLHNVVREMESLKLVPKKKEREE